MILFSLPLLQTLMCTRHITAHDGYDHAIDIANDIVVHSKNDVEYDQCLHNIMHVVQNYG